MRYLIAVLCILAGSTAFSQQWHPANRKLRSPKNTSGYYSTVGYINRYAAIPCTYVTRGSDQFLKGYKFVYVRQGHYVDNAKTFRVFYDAQFNRIGNVDRFYFK
jgi:hypothetical protein